MHLFLDPFLLFSYRGIPQCYRSPMFHSLIYNQRKQSSLGLLQRSSFLVNIFRKKVTSQATIISWEGTRMVAKTCHPALGVRGKVGGFRLQDHPGLCEETDSINEPSNNKRDVDTHRIINTQMYKFRIKNSFLKLDKHPCGHLSPSLLTLMLL